MLAADALMNLFSGHQGLGGGFGGGFAGVPQAAAAEYVPASFSNPWGGDPNDLGGAPKEPLDGDKFAGPAQVDNSAWTPAPDAGGGAQQADNSGWQDAPDQGGGWDQAADDGGGGFDDIQNT